MAALGEIKRDTGAFTTRQWFVESDDVHIRNCGFTTREDAEAAVRIAGLYARRAVEDKVADIRAALDRVT